MSNARDKANIPALNFSSTGIDDNATSTAITIDSSQNVGIGTITPTGNLHISSSGESTILLQSTAGSSTYAPTITTNGTAKLYGNQGRVASTGAFSSNHFLTEWDDANGYALSHRWYTGSSAERMRITSAGRIGIGTTAPDATLEVNSGNGDTNSIFKSTDNNCLIIISDNDSSSTIAVDNDGSGGALKFNTGGDGSYSGNSEAMRIDSSGNVGIGTTSIKGRMTVDAETNSGRFHVGTVGGGAYGISVLRDKDDTDDQILHFSVQENSTKTRACEIEMDYTDNAMIFRNGYYDHSTYDINDANDDSNFPERMRIDSSGNLLIKKTTSGFNTAGFEVKSGDEPIYVTTENNSNILVNRRSSDGSLIRFYRSTSEKGSISVSGETVSYNGFTGSHWSRFTDNSKPTILRGTVLETLDEMLDWYNLEYNITTTTKDEDGNDVTNTETFGVPHVLTDSQSVGDTITYNHNGTDVQATIVKEADVKHMMSKVSDTTDAKNVYGVFNCYDEEQSEEGYNDFLVASVGSFLVRIKGNEIIAKGDLLQSNGDGTAKVQTDDAVRSSSFAKVLSTTIIETYEDGSYLVPCSLMC